MNWGLKIATFALTVAMIVLIAVIDAQAAPNANPPSVIPGPTDCEQVNCKRRRVWRKRYRALSAADQGWLRRTRNCESRYHGLYRANTRNGYFGAYQFSASTARAAGFTMLPHRVFRYEQDVRAIRWRNRAGRSQWPICGRH